MFKKKGVFAISILFCIMLISLVSSATYYVSPTGNDSDSGNETNPWSTIGQHLYGANYTNLNSGDTMIVLNGTYEEPATALNGIFTQLTNVVVQGESRDGVIVNMTTGNTHGFYLYNAGLSVYNLTIINYNSNGKCFWVRDNSGNFTFANNKCLNATYGLDVYYPTTIAKNFVLRDNIFVQQNYPIVIDNINKTPTNATFFNNIINYTEDVVNAGGIPRVINNSIVSDALQNGDINLTQNTFNIKALHFNNWTQYAYENNTWNYQKLIFYNFNPSEQYTFRDNLFTFTNYAVTSNEYGLEFDDSNNILLDNVTFCSYNSPCSFSGGTSFTAIYGDANSDNIIINNSKIYLENGNLLGISLFGNYNEVRNSIIHHNGSSGVGVRIVNNSVINNVTLYRINSTAGYGLFCGAESLGSGRTKNCSITNNIVYSNYSQDNSSSLHTVFMGYTEDSYLINNTIYGGGYGLAIKGNVNGLFENNIIYNPGFQGMTDKGGLNNIYRNITFYDLNVTAIYIQSDEDEMNVTNDSFYDVTFNCDASCPISQTSNTSILFYDVIGYSSYIVSGTNSNATIYYSVTLTTIPSLINLNFLDVLSNSYDYTSQDNIYLKYALLNATGNITYSHYTYVASASGYKSATGTFNLTAPYTLSIVLDQTVDSGTRSIFTLILIFIVFMILAPIFLFLFKNGELDVTGITVKELIIMFIIISVGVAFLVVIAQNLGSV